MEKNEEFFVRCGTVVFLEDSKGSKSEGVFPFLRDSDEVCTKVMLKGDNPFENNGLRPYEGQKIEALCTQGRGNTLIVHSLVRKDQKNI